MANLLGIPRVLLYIFIKPSLTVGSAPDVNENKI